MRTRQAVSTLQLTNKPRYTMQGFGEIRRAAPMGGWLDDLWDSGVNAASSAIDKAIPQLQAQVVKEATKQLYKIVGIDGSTKTVAADSPEYTAYLAANQTPIPVAPNIFEQYQKEILIGGAVIGGLVVLSVLWKIIRPAPAPMMYRMNPTKKVKKKSKKLGKNPSSNPDENQEWGIVIKERNGEEIYQAKPLEGIPATKRKSFSKIIEGTYEDVLEWMDMHKQLLN